MKAQFDRDGRGQVWRQEAETCGGAERSGRKTGDRRVKPASVCEGMVREAGGGLCRTFDDNGVIRASRQERQGRGARQNKANLSN